MHIAKRTFEKLPKKYWFHGTTTEYYESLSSNIDISICKTHTDFGRGFYLTTNFTQASRHAENRGVISGDRPIVFIYELDVARLKKEYTGKTWTVMDEKWSDFIYLNRSKLETFNHGFDYVYGGVADGIIHTLIKNRDQGKLNSKEFYNQICKYPNYDQLSIHNQNIIDYNILKNIKVVNAYAKSKEYVGSE